ncbi:MAG: hypothetical protein JSS43_23050 [Proteobacteria bacterium]|nr:hypothetical protein [Pseudomonadota bacterium]
MAGRLAGTAAGRVLRAAALISVALYLVPVGAHVAELAAKLALPPDQYMIVQQIYAGWALFGVFIAAALLITLVQAALAWRDGVDRGLSFAAFLCLAATQIVFWMFTYPMNVETRNWTVMPAMFDSARWQWEFSHAASAALTAAAFLCLVAGTVRRSGRW